MRTCTKCDRDLPLDQFHADGRGGRRHQCKDCLKRYQKERLVCLQHNTPDEKVCYRCKQSLPATEFGTDRSTTSGLTSYCKSCRYAVHKERVANQIVTPVAEKRCGVCKLVLDASLFANRDISKDGLHSWCRACAQLRKIELQYNITPERYREMAKDGCWICASFERLEVDHDHACCPGASSCGKCVRGILCKRHNQGSGFFRDDPAELIATAEYLTANRRPRLDLVGT